MLITFELYIPYILGGIKIKMEEKESNFFKKIWTSITDFEEYEEFAAEKVSKAIKYLILLTLIFTIIIGIAYTYKFNLAVNGVKSYVRENIEDIKMTDRKIRCYS